MAYASSWSWKYLELVNGLLGRDTLMGEIRPQSLIY